MFKHIEDEGDLNILISDSGGLVFVCSKCKKVWSSQIVPDGSNLKPEREDVSPIFRLLATQHSKLFEKMGIERSFIEKIKDSQI